jgi:hypothetical protein
MNLNTLAQTMMSRKIILRHSWKKNIFVFQYNNRDVKKLCKYYLKAEPVSAILIQIREQTFPKHYIFLAYNAFAFLSLARVIPSNPFSYKAHFPKFNSTYFFSAT